MNIYLIEQPRTGEILSIISAEDEDDALDAYARSQGWSSFRNWRDVTMIMPGELRVAPVEALG